MLTTEQEAEHLCRLAVYCACYACCGCAVVRVYDARNVLSGASAHLRPGAFPACCVKILPQSFP